MLRLVVFSALLYLAHCSCPEGFELVRAGQCRGLYTALTDIGFSDTTPTAIAKCNEINGLPVIIHDAEDQAYWVEQKNTVANGDRDAMAMGIVCNTDSMRWEWADGSVIDYKPAEYNGALDNSCGPNCSWTLRMNGLWNMGCNDCSGYPEKVFCTTQLQKPVPSSDECINFESDRDDGVCYQIGATSETWNDAQSKCRKVGANLASIHNLQENSFIRRLAVSHGAVDGVYLGAVLTGKGGSYGWIDGTPWNYDYFAPGFPVKGRGDCLAMDTISTSGQWMNVNCSSKLAVACVRESNLKPSCSPGPWKEEQIIVSPGFPYDSSTPCDYYLTVPSGKKVQVEILFLEANSCCDYLVLTDDVLGGNIVANLTGEISDQIFTTSSSNLMRVSWVPNGGVNVQGMMMKFRGV